MNKIFTYSVKNGDAGSLALWGENSYNIGAGMARLRTAAGFIQAYMPWRLFPRILN